MSAEFSRQETNRSFHFGRYKRVGSKQALFAAANSDVPFDWVVSASLLFSVYLKTMKKNGDIALALLPGFLPKPGILPTGPTPVQTYRRKAAMIDLESHSSCGPTKEHYRGTCPDDILERLPGLPPDTLRLNWSCVIYLPHTERPAVRGEAQKKKGASSREKVADRLVVQDLIVALEVVLQTTGRLPKQPSSTRTTKAGVHG